MNAWIAFALGLPGFAALGMAMERHQDELFARPLSDARRWLCRLAGAALLCASLGACIAAWSVSVGILAWAGALTGASMSVGTILTYRPRWLLPLSFSAGIVASCAWAFGL
ncbi:DUF3325 domain-containing protein [Acidovorax cavernicola]|uniref:DUF3325 domain-containing protein n=1 Tax=Acidovorax cavernicola TaxID=1675792 RepID=A0A9X8D448_9BURK|nr:DUF3325 domain-containing protein [Acidovorax cavernicola]RIX78639.1 DUF3325 domain-containing protein [Acidovorax cavernicola]